MIIRSSTPEIVCLQCGDVGFSNAFVFCVKCLKFAVHRYCLNVIPKSLDEFVRWLCDDCEAEEQNQRPLLKNDAIRHKKRDFTTSEHIQGDTGTGTKKNGTVALTREEPAPQSYDPCAKIDLVERSVPDSDCHAVGLGMIDEEAIVLSAADASKRREQSSSCNLSADTSQRDIANAATGMRKDQHTPCDNSSATKEMKASKASLKRGHVLHHHGSDPETTAAPPRFSSYSGSFGISKKMKPDMPSPANLKDQECKPLFAQHLKKHEGIGVGTPRSDTTTERRSINLSRESGVTKDRRSPASNHSYSRNGFSKDSTISPVIGCSIRSEPVMQPIWRGSFNISNHEGDMLEDVMAHMSIEACQKVNDETCQFKPVLQLEMLPRSHVWPKSFGDSESSAGNIALYFFPSESERFYDDLVNEMMEEELALKAIVKNAELLVFPSTKLPLSHWRFHGKYYLWGVFREKQAPALRTWSRQNPVMHRDRVDDNGAIASMNRFGRQRPLSPLRNCSRYGSRIS
ncbi:uncharacterized protein LOC130992411 isoform X2 [Salvia miltiorrhiza]|uniref:uncharacterized protein LOC130992411 isoform X2 n=1 Tax=Salvia miltiorrhiza TaxID=226208 RepID=UPI0025ABF92B|nr:uncharacterized protein LOC130992411 isoform X2 [Salvia miltiorrhiza]XP_057773068.1 uncharacterized protein LOC130992411 isoform X2 [Salvia miltiorrhiza]XP_057773075.1 uncharacterized protein LOC130992411 isoform X2 [Salvia miltiorrhiza]